MAAKPARKPTAKGKHPAHGKHPASGSSHLQAEISGLQREVHKLQSEIHPNHKHAPPGKHGQHPAKGKHAATAKHGNSHKPAPAKGKGGKRGLALPGDAACCAAEALAASLRLAGRSVDPDEVLALFLATPGADEDGASILATLGQAQRSGLAGAYPTWEPAAALTRGVVAGITLPYGPHTVTVDRGGVWTWGEWRPVPASFESAIEEAWEVTWL